MNALDFIREKEQEVENLFKDWHIEKLASEIEEFAEKYHQAKLKLLGIGVISQQRELLKGYEEWLENVDLNTEH